MFHEHLQLLVKFLCNAGILCLRFTMKTPNFMYRVKCFAVVVVGNVFECQMQTLAELYFIEGPKLSYI